MRLNSKTPPVRLQSMMFLHIILVKSSRSKINKLIRMSKEVGWFKRKRSWMKKQRKKLCENWGRTC